MRVLVEDQAFAFALDPKDAAQRTVQKGNKPLKGTIVDSLLCPTCLMLSKQNLCGIVTEL